MIQELAKWIADRHPLAELKAEWEEMLVGKEPFLEPFGRDRLEINESPEKGFCAGRDWSVFILLSPRYDGQTVVLDIIGIDKIRVVAVNWIDLESGEVRSLSREQEMQLEGELRKLWES